MLGTEEKKSIRLEFWNRLRAYTSNARRKAGKSPRFILNNTGIRQLKLKLEFDENKASVGVDIETRNLDKRIELLQKLEELRPHIEKSLGKELLWEMDYRLPTGKSISRIAAEMNGVSIYRREDHGMVIPFMYKKMSKLEDFYLEFREFIKP